MFLAEVGADVWGKISLFIRSSDKQRGSLHYHAAWASTSWCYALIAPRMGSFRLGCTRPRPCFHATALHFSLPPQSRLASSLPNAFLFSPHRRGGARRKGPSKCQVVCASVKNACRASSLLNVALALVSVMSLDNWIRYPLTLCDSHSFSLCLWQQKPRPGKLSVLNALKQCWSRSHTEKKDVKTGNQKY